MKKLLAIGLTSLMLTGCATATQPSKTETATSKTAEAETRLDSQTERKAGWSPDKEAVTDSTSILRKKDS